MVESVEHLLQKLAALSGFERYAQDEAKIELLCGYLWARRFAPELPLERFLECLVTACGGGDHRAWARPEDALDRHCPKQGDTTENAGWTERERAEILRIYIDALRMSEAAGDPLRMDLDQFLEAVAPSYRSGFADPSSTAGEEPARPAEPPASPVTGRAIYEVYPGGRAYRGFVLREYFDGALAYVDFQSDDGEIFRHIAASQILPCSDPFPKRLPNVERHTVELSGAEYYLVSQMLSRRDYEESHSPLYQKVVELPHGKIYLNVWSGHGGPYVDPYFERADGKVTDLPPRRNIEGDYWFTLSDDTALCLTVSVEGGPSDGA